jgi:predicted nucleic acid-binding protein
VIVLDTSVIAELMRQDPDDAVFRWVDQYPADEVSLRP